MSEEGTLIGKVDCLNKKEAKELYEKLDETDKEIVDDLMKMENGGSIPIGRAKTLQKAVHLLNISDALKNND